MDFGIKMQGGEPVSAMKVLESEGKLEGLATAVAPNKNSSSRGGGAKGWQYRYDPFSRVISCGGE